MPEIVLEDAPADFVPSGQGATQQATPPPVQLEDAPADFQPLPSATPPDQGILDKISSYLALAGKKTRGALGLPEPEALDAEKAKAILGDAVGNIPILGSIAGPVARMAGQNPTVGAAEETAGRFLYGTGTDPLTYAPLGSLAKFGKPGMLAVKAVSAAFGVLQAKGLEDSIPELRKQLEASWKDGTLTPDAAKAITSSVLQAAGVGLGAMGALAGHAATPEAPTPLHDIPAGDRALLEQINAAKTANPNVDVSNLMRGIEAEKGAVRPGDVAAINKIVEALPPREAVPEATPPEAPSESYIYPAEALKGTTFEDHPHTPVFPLEPPSHETMQRVLGGEEGPQYTPPEEAPPTPETPPEAAATAPPPDTAPQSLEQRQQPILDQLSAMGVDMAAGKRQGPRAQEPSASPSTPAIETKPEGAPLSVTDLVLPERKGEAGALIVDSIDPSRPGKITRPFAMAVGDLLSRAVSATKALRFSADVSGMRTGLRALLESPTAYFRAAKDQFKYMRSEAAYEDLGRDLARRSQALKDYSGASFKDLGVDLTVPDPDAPIKEHGSEEQFQSVDASKIGFVRASDRAYSGMMSQLRADLTEMNIRALVDQGKDFTSHPEEFKAMAKFINVITQRGSLGDLGPRATKVLNGIFTSPKAIAASIQQFTMLMPGNDIPLSVKAKLLKNQLKLYAALVATNYVGKQAGYVTENDPTHPDWGKLRDGKVRLDFSAGAIPLVRAIAIGLLGKQTKLSGRVVDQSWGKTLVEYGKNRLAPIPRDLVDAATSEDEAHRKKALLHMGWLMAPIITETAVQLAKTDVGLRKMLMYLGFEATGVPSVNVYDEPANLTPEDKAAFRAKHESEMQTQAIRERTPIPPKEPKTPQLQAESAAKTLKREIYREQIAKALQAGDEGSAYRIKLDAAGEGINIDVEELNKRLSPDGELTSHPTL